MEIPKKKLIETELVDRAFDCIDYVNEKLKSKNYGSYVDDNTVDLNEEFVDDERTVYYDAPKNENTKIKVKFNPVKFMVMVSIFITLFLFIIFILNAIFIEKLKNMSDDMLKIKHSLKNIQKVDYNQQYTPNYNKVPNHNQFPNYNQQPNYYQQYTPNYSFANY